VALVLQGGGALGSYQAGVCEGLAAEFVTYDLHREATARIRS
jgi:predicted acylesterase/phospholipase RssA